MKKLLSVLLALSVSTGSAALTAVSAAETAVPEAAWANISHTDKAVNITWKNPKYASADEDKAVSKVSLYQTADGSDTLVKDDFTVTSEKKQNYTVSNLTNGEEYTYKLVFEFKNYSPLEVVLKDKPGTAENRLGNVNSSSVVRTTSGFNVTVDTENHNGTDSTASIKVDSVSSGKEWVDIFQLAGIARTSGGKYKVSFDYKSEGTAVNPMLIGGWGKAVYYSAGTHDWITVSDTIDSWTEAGYLYFKANSGGTGWYDNISVYALDSAGNVTGGNLADTHSAENLIKNLGITTPAITASAENKGAKITWGDVGAEYMNIYVKKDGKLYPRASVPASDKSVVIGSLVNGEETEIAVKASLNGVEANEASAKVTPKAPITAVPEAAWANISHTDSALNITWKNPSYIKADEDKAVSKVSIYQTVNGRDKLIKNDFDITSKKKQNYTVSNLTNGEEYTYKLVFEFNNYSPLEIVLKDKPGTAENRLGNVAKSSVVRDTAGFNVTVDTENHNGAGSTASIKVDSVSSGKEWVDIFQLAGIARTSGGKYKVSFDYKSEGTAVNPMLIGGWGKAVYYNGGTHDWITVSDTIDSWTEPGYLYFKANSGGTGWYDNISVYALDSDGNVTGSNLADTHSAENLIENLGITTPAITVSAENKGAKITWGDVDAEYINIYVKKDGKLYPRASVPASDKAAFIGSLVNGEKTEIAVKASLNGVEANEASAKVTSTEAAYETGGYKLYSGENEIADITAAGTYKVSVKLTNNSAAQGQSAQLIVAQYDGENLTGIEKTDQITVAKGDTYNFERDFTVVNPNYTVRVFLWDSLNGMNPVKDSTEL